MAGRRSHRLGWIGIVGGLVLAACGSEAPVVSRASTVPTPTTSAVTAATTTTPPPAPEPIATDPPGPDPAPAPAPVEALDRAGGAGQAVVVIADGYGATTATLTAWQRGPAGAWEAVHGPWPAQVGYAGFAPPGDKREGDGRTPTGTFGFDFSFGIEPDPGVALPYRRLTGPSIVWDDVPASPTYNLWVDGGVGEPMHVSPVYDYGAVIAYNAERTPGLGSAIFLHVSTGRPTAGCVSLPVDRLLAVLRWLDPARAPVIVMGVA